MINQNSTTLQKPFILKKKLPTKTGYYWFQKHPKQPRILFFNKATSQVTTTHTGHGHINCCPGGWSHISSYNGLWSNRIPYPISKPKKSIFSLFNKKIKPKKVTVNLSSVSEFRILLINSGLISDTALIENLANYLYTQLLSNKKNYNYVT